MKKMSWITGVLLCAMIVLSALGSVCNAVWQIAIDETFYNEQSRAAVKAAMGYETEEEVTAYIGLTTEEQKNFAEIMSAYILGEDQSIDLPFYVSTDEVRHMIDVRGLLWSVRDLGKTCLTMGTVLAVIAAWTSARLKERGKVTTIAVLSGAAVVELAVMSVTRNLNKSGFAHMFAKMHEALFTNDLWLMNPAEDILIRIMPQQLFEQGMLNAAGTALRMTLIVTVALLVIYFMVGAMIRRNMKKENA